MIQPCTKRSILDTKLINGINPHTLPTAASPVNRIKNHPAKGRSHDPFRVQKGKE